MSLAEEGTAATAKEGLDFDSLGKHMSINERVLHTDCRVYRVKMYTS